MRVSTKAWRRCALVVALAFTWRSPPAASGLKLSPKENIAPVDPLVLLQRSSSPSATESAPQLLSDRRCIAVVVADGYLLAQASCVARLERDALQPLKFAEFGAFATPPIDLGGIPPLPPPPMRPTPSSTPRPRPTLPPVPTLNGTTPAPKPRPLPPALPLPLPPAPSTGAASAADATNTTAARLLEQAARDNETITSPPSPQTGARDLVRIKSIKYHPQFAHSSGNDDDESTFINNDFVVIEYAGAPAREFDPFSLLSNTALMARMEMKDPNFGLLQVDRKSLAVTWLVWDVLMSHHDICGIDPTSLQGQCTACARSPRFKTRGGTNLTAAGNGSSNATALGPQQTWTMLFHRAQERTSYVYFLGFASGASKVATTQPVLWPYPAKAFIDKPTVYGVHWDEFGVGGNTDFPGPPVTWLPPHLAFVTGLRLHKQGPNFCGGSLIGATFVLTAAHCVESSFPPTYVSVGSLKTSGTREGEQIKVRRIIRHPQYTTARPANDLALIELEYASVRDPVPILNSPRFVPKTATVFGYGAMDATSDGPVPSEDLRFGELNVIARNAECEKLFQEPIDKSMFCAGGARQKDTCVGDSGGPLLVTSPKMSGLIALAGVISYGRGECGVASFPGVYANVTSAEAFIRQYVLDAKWTSGLMGTPFPPPSPPLALEPTRTPVTSASSGASLPETLAPAEPATSNPASTPPALSPSPSSSVVPDRNGAGSRSSAIDGSVAKRPDESTGANTGPTKAGDASASPGAIDNTLKVPATLPPRVKDALVAFLVGSTDQISASRATALLQRSTLVLHSTQSLERIEAVLTAHSRRVLNQRTARFGDAATAVNRSSTGVRTATQC